MRVNIKNAFAVLLVLFVMDSAFIAHATRFTYILRDIFCVGALSAAIYIFYQYFYNKSQKERWLEPLILSALVAMFILAATLILVIINKALSVITFQWIYYIAKLYFLIGLGIGIGIMLTEEPYADKLLMYFRNFFNN
jgi:O-antigen/teichoic acid export membrane protein